MPELVIAARYHRQWPESGDTCLESQLSEATQTLTIPTDQAALVLVDVWDIHPNESHRARSAEITRTRIAPVVEAARAAGLTIVHAPSPPVARKYPQWTKYAGDGELSPPAATAPDWPPPEFAHRTGAYARYARPYPHFLDAWQEPLAARRIMAEVEPQPDDFVVATGPQLHRLLRARRVLHLFYAGFATNMCVPGRDYGLRAFRSRGYNLILLRDCTTAIETDDTVGEMLITRMAIRDFELNDLAWTTTAEAFLQACRG